MLTSHVRAMAHRSISGEPLPEVGRCRDGLTGQKPAAASCQPGVRSALPAPLRRVLLHDVGEQAAQTERLADKMLQQVFALLSRHGIVPNCAACSPTSCITAPLFTSDTPLMSLGIKVAPGGGSCDTSHAIIAVFSFFQ
jgi:hypothetical protein